MSASGDAIVVDARGHRCPVPALRLRRAMAVAEPGSRVTLLADDPLAKVDVPHLAAALGWSLVEIHSEGAVLRFMLRA